MKSMATLLEKPILVSNGHYMLRIRHDFGECMPGQFVNVRVCNGTDPLLRRPFSVFNCDGDTLDLVIKVVGKGTDILSRLEPGEIDLIGPMGRGFSMEKSKTVLLAGGGVGNAPLFPLAKALRKINNTVHYIYGIRSRESIYLEKEYRENTDSIIFTTDDGTYGTRGSVVDSAERVLKEKNFDRIYTCGPLAMMRSIVETAGKVPVQISVENYFGCGIGLCMGCTIETSDGMKRACVDGPVFEGSTIKWDSL